MVIESAHSRVLRILVVSIGIGSIVFTLLGLGGIVEQQDWHGTALSTAMVVIVCGVPPVLALVAHRIPIMALRVLSGIHAASALIFLAIWYPAMSPEFLPATSTPWLMNIISVATCLAAIALPPIAAWVYLIAVAVGGGLLRFGLLGASDVSLPFQDAVMLALFSVVVVSLVQLALRSGRKQDEASIEAQQEAASVGTEETIERQRARYQAFTRDEVLATLHEASLDSFGNQVAIRQRASQALHKMAELRSEKSNAAFVTASEFELLLRASATLEVPIGVNVSEPAGTRVLIPADVADGLSEALAEAVSNSLTHAGIPGGRPVLRRARATMSPTSVDIVMTDDGRGFSLRQVRLDRFGVRVGILQRVNAIHGCTATVTSSRRDGTSVTLSWRKGTNA